MPPPATVAPLAIAYPGLRSPLPAEREAAFRSLYQDHVADVYRVATRSGLRPAESEDVTQQVFVRAHRLLGGPEEVRHVRAWLRGVTVRVASEHRRWERVRRFAAAVLGDDDDEPASEASGPEASAAMREERARIALVLGRISEPLREVLVLADLHEADQAEVALALGITENTVRSRRFRAREEFRRIWRRYHGDA